MTDPPNNSAFEISREIFTLGLNFLQMNRISLASFHFRKALSFDPFFTDAALYLAHCLHLEKKYDEALKVYDQLLLGPKSALILNNRGNTLLEMYRYGEAAYSYEQALELAPERHDARVALATCYQALGRFGEAMTACDKVLSTSSANAEAHWNKALLLLLQGRYREGWQEYEWRWQKRNFTSPLWDFQQPRWNGEPAVGKTVLIHAEQGFGDTLQFCRYIPLVADLGLQVIFECHSPLASLMKSLDSRIVVISLGNPLPHFDLHLPLLTLPLIFDTTLETIPVNIPYIKPSNTNLSLSHFFDTPDFKVGICWAGKSYPDPGRSCPSEFLEPLGKLDRISWYSLQMQENGNLPFPMIDLVPFIKDFSDTAMLINNLDLIITVDTAVAHLAGAMGKPAWVMLPYASDWRWMLNRSDSPWYPSMRLFRQEKPGEWEGVIRELASALGQEALVTNKAMNDVSFYQ